MKTPEEILQQDKYKGLKGLLLICDAMDEHSSQFTSQIEELTKEVERLEAENKSITASYNALDDIYRRTLKRLEVAESDNRIYREALEAEMSPRVASLLIKVRDEIAKENISEAYHALYQIASPDFDKTESWGKVEKIAALHPLVKEGE
jgi:chromosome segregation ATPase